MAVFWGVALAVAVAGFAALVGFDRERSFYPVVLVVIAIIYDLFAAMAGATSAITPELAAGALFVGAAIAGYRWNLWIAAAGLALHGLFDLAHSGLIANPGVPDWWPAFCSAYDIVAGACLAWLILSGRQSAAPEAPMQRTS